MHDGNRFGRRVAIGLIGVEAEAGRARARHAGDAGAGQRVQQSDEGNGEAFARAS
jgi:hypothetical protein